MTDSQKTGATEEREMAFIDESVIARLQDEDAALKLTVQMSGLQNHEVADALDIDHGQWSRILSGKSHFPHRKLKQLFDVCGNEALLQYLNYTRGYECQPRRRKSCLELELEEARRRLAEKDRETELLMQALQGRANAK